MNRLSDTEREELRQAVVDAHACVGSRDKWVEHVEPVVEAIVAARLASVDALADEWDGDEGRTIWHNAAADLRAVLGSDAHTEQKGTGR